MKFINSMLAKEYEFIVYSKGYIPSITAGTQHNPHASDKPYLLSLSINDSCIGCHKAQETGRHIVSLPARSIHPVKGVPNPRNPREEISCASCHDPHSSNFPKLSPTIP